jgi:hypothetical protein
VVRVKDEEFLRQAVSRNHRLIPTPSTWPNGLLRLNSDGERWLQDWWWYACGVTYQGGPEWPLCDDDREQSMMDRRGPERPLYDGNPEWSKTDGRGPERPSYDDGPERSKTDGQGSQRPLYYGNPERLEANGRCVKTPTFYAMRRGDGG